MAEVQGHLTFISVAIQACQSNLGSTPTCPSYPTLTFFFLAFCVLHPCFLTVKHCIGGFLFFNLQIIFILLFL